MGADQLRHPPCHNLTPCDHHALLATSLGMSTASHAISSAGPRDLAQCSIPDPIQMEANGQVYIFKLLLILCMSFGEGGLVKISSAE